MEEKITIKKFVEGYQNCKTSDAVERYLKKNLKVIPYLSFVKKKTLAEKLIDISMFEYENYKDKDNIMKRRKTGNLKVDSVVQYLLFCRIIIENYTNLKIESEGFFEEYDLLNSNGLMDYIFQSIPEKEISDFKTIIDMTKSDVMFNEFDVHNYLSKQIERIVTIGSTVLEPVLENLVNSIDNIDEDTIASFVDAIGRKDNKLSNNKDNNVIDFSNKDN